MGYLVEGEKMMVDRLCLSLLLVAVAWGFPAKPGDIVADVQSLASGSRNLADDTAKVAQAITSKLQQVEQDAKSKEADLKKAEDEKKTELAKLTQEVQTKKAEEERNQALASAMKEKAEKDKATKEAADIKYSAEKAAEAMQATLNGEKGRADAAVRDMNSKAAADNTEFQGKVQTVAGKLEAAQKEVEKKSIALNKAITALEKLNTSVDGLKKDIGVAIAEAKEGATKFFGEMFSEMAAVTEMAQ